MMRRAMAAGALALLAFAVQAATATEADRLAWMEGRWGGEKDGVTSEERWTGVLGGHSSEYTPT